MLGVYKIVFRSFFAILLTGALVMFLQGWKYLLLGAANDSPLCQMALAYRHLIGSDGLHQDCDVAIGRTLLFLAFRCSLTSFLTPFSQ